MPRKRIEDMNAEETAYLIEGGLARLDKRSRELAEIEMDEQGQFDEFQLEELFNPNHKKFAPGQKETLDAFNRTRIRHKNLLSRQKLTVKRVEEATEHLSKLIGDE